MSLVYDALRQSQADGSVTRDLPAPPKEFWTHALAYHRRPALWLLSGMLVAGPVGFLLSRPAAVVEATVPVADAIFDTGNSESPTLPPADVQPSAPVNVGLSLPAAENAPAPRLPELGLPAPARTVVPAPAVMATAAGDVPTAADASAQETAVTATAPDIATAQTPHQAPAATASNAAMEGRPPSARTEVPIVASQIRVSVRKTDTVRPSTTSEDTDDNAVRGIMAALNAAVSDHDADGTATALARLQHLLPAESLTLLRAHAWAAHGSGDHEQAERLYQAIIDRVPDDEYAGINLALLDARRGDISDARARLDRIAARNGRSPRILQALAELDAVSP